jgi:hypothetical protein
VPGGKNLATAGASTGQCTNTTSRHDCPSRVGEGSGGALVGGSFSLGEWATCDPFPLALSRNGPSPRAR